MGFIDFQINLGTSKPSLRELEVPSSSHQGGQPRTIALGRPSCQTLFEQQSADSLHHQKSVTGEHMNDDEIKIEIASSNHQVKEYIAQLTAENARLNKALVKREVSILSLNNRIKALEEEIKENKPELKINVNLGDNSKPA